MTFMNMNDWEFTPSRLATLRSLKGLSQRDFGRMIKRSNVTVLNWEKGRMCPTAKDLAVIANTFGVDPRSFFTQKANNEKKVA